MSDMSALATQYNQLMAITDDVNDSVKLIVKSELAQENPQMKQLANFNFKPEQIAKAKDKLTVLLRTLLHLVTNELTSAPLLELPNVIVEDYHSRLKDVKLQQEFRNLLKAIEEDEPIGKMYQRVLEEIVTTLDTDRRQFYRKLRARR
ncbi:hypothetical protein BH09BAC4_BH09BAC4_21100 [soil metagenome]